MVPMIPKIGCMDQAVAMECSLLLLKVESLVDLIPDISKTNTK